MGGAGGGQVQVRPRTPQISRQRRAAGSTAGTASGASRQCGRQYLAPPAAWKIDAQGMRHQFTGHPHACKQQLTCTLSAGYQSHADTFDMLSQTVISTGRCCGSLTTLGLRAAPGLRAFEPCYFLSSVTVNAARPCFEKTMQRGRALSLRRALCSSSASIN